jgi:hypothetical protein
MSCLLTSLVRPTLKRQLELAIDVERSQGRLRVPKERCSTARGNGSHGNLSGLLPHSSARQPLAPLLVVTSLRFVVFCVAGLRGLEPANVISKVLVAARARKVSGPKMSGDPKRIRPTFQRLSQNDVCGFESSQPSHAVVSYAQAGDCGEDTRQRSPRCCRDPQLQRGCTSLHESAYCISVVCPVAVRFSRSSFRNLAIVGAVAVNT